MAADVKDIKSVSQIKPIKLNNIPKNVKAYGELQSAAAEAAGEVSNYLKKIEKAEGYNKAAFKLAVSLNKKTSQKRQDFLMTFDAMRDKLGWDNEQADMLEAGDDDEESNVVALDAPQPQEEDAPSAPPMGSLPH